MVAVSAGVGLAAVAPATVAQAANTTYYVNCQSGSDSATGTAPNKAWKTIAKVNSKTFGPGDQILFARGTSCTGVLQPKGSGTVNNPITIGGYGSGARPKIVGTGARATILLQNVQGYTIKGLEVTNPAPADGTARVGIYVQLTNFGTGKGYQVTDNYVHDVPGCDCLDPLLENSGGILFEAAGSTTATAFDQIQINKNTVSGTDNVGIGIISLWSKRTPLYPAGQNTFVPITNVRVANNTVSDQGGDGILVMNGRAPVIAQNLVSGFGLRASQSHGGILAFNSDDANVKSNEVTGGAANPPSFAFSVDAATKNLLVQYNYSHDNNGPFLLMCAPPGSTIETPTVRFNVSDNDKDIAAYGIPVLAGGCFGSDAPITGAKVYNNTIYSPTATTVVAALPNAPITFTNNIFIGAPSGSSIADPAGTYKNNLYQNISTTTADTTAVKADPLLTNAAGTGSDGFRLQCGSPAINKGIKISANGARDFFDNPTPTDQPLNIGADNGKC